MGPLSSAQSAYDNLTAGEYKDALIDAITILPQAKTLKAKTIANKIKNIISKDKSKKDVKIQNTKEAAMALKQKTERELMERYGLKTYKDLKREGYQNVGRSKNILWARDSKQIREIGRDLIKYARYIGKDKGKVGGNVDTYLTKDKKIKINLRDESKSGGKTTELMFHEKENIKTKIHSIEDLRNLKK